MNEKMNKKMNPAHSDVQGDKATTLQLDLMKQYLRDTVQREHSVEWWSVMFEFASHYKEA